MNSKNEIVSLNQKELIQNLQKGALIGGTSISLTFFPIDKTLAYGMKMSSENHKGSSLGTSFFLQQTMKGNFSVLWNNSLYLKASRAALQHPFKGYPIALLSSSIKDMVFFPAKYAAERALRELSDEKSAKRYSGFLGGLVTVYLTTPVSVLKTRMMTNVPINTLTPKRLMSGVNAIALRDSFQYGVYFNAVDFLKKQFGDNTLVAGTGGILGYIISNPFNVIAFNQKTSTETFNISNMAKKIFKASGVKGFYPLMGLSALGMFARGAAIGYGSKLYDSLTSETKELTVSPTSPK